jgi:hypothetical protein
MPPKSPSNTQSHSLTEANTQTNTVDQIHQIRQASQSSSVNPTLTDQPTVRKASRLSIGSTLRSTSQAESSKASESPSLLRRLRNQSREIAARTINRIRRRKDRGKEIGEDEDLDVQGFTHTAAPGQPAEGLPQSASTSAPQASQTGESTQVPIRRTSRFTEGLETSQQAKQDAIHPSTPGASSPRLEAPPTPQIRPSSTADDPYVTSLEDQTIGDMAPLERTTSQWVRPEDIQFEDNRAAYAGTASTSGPSSSPTTQGQPSGVGRTRSLTFVEPPRPLQATDSNDTQIRTSDYNSSTAAAERLVGAAEGSDTEFSRFLEQAQQNDAQREQVLQQHATPAYRWTSVERLVGIQELMDRHERPVNNVRRPSGPTSPPPVPPTPAPTPNPPPQPAPPPPDPRNGDRPQYHDMDRPADMSERRWGKQPMPNKGSSSDRKLKPEKEVKPDSKLMPPPLVPGRVPFPSSPDPRSKDALISMGKGKQAEFKKVPLTGLDGLGIPRPDSPVLGAGTSLA